ncbi:MAG: hypothetical protein DCC50_05495 [Acidobacteria bacterium]|nr:MAG: hypothetical protein DCC50_05495 [Acidobacteriota bacterium]
MTGPGHGDVAGDELERVVRRWQQLPLDRALPAVPGVSAAVQALADAVADEQGMEPATVPDLGPGVLMDQLRVMVHDWRAAGLDEADLAARLTALRRALP